MKLSNLTIVKLHDAERSLNRETDSYERYKEINNLNEFQHGNWQDSINHRKEFRDSWSMIHEIIIKHENDIIKKHETPSAE